MTTSDGVTLQHPAMSITDLYPRLDTDTISILSSQSDSVQHLSYNESDDDGKDLVDYNSSHPYDTINQTYQPSALKKDWITYLTKSSNGNNDKHYRSSSDDRSSPLTSPSSSSALSPVPDNDANSTEDPWIINKVQRDYYTKQFQSLQTDHTKFINGHVAKEFFERSNLPTSELSYIWNLSDVNHDGALSLEEFCTAMHLVVLRLNGFQLPDELPLQLQPFASSTSLSDATSTTSWASFQQKADSPKEFTFSQPVADNHRIVAPVAVRFSSPSLPSPQTVIKPPPPPPRTSGRTATHDTSQQRILPTRTAIHKTPQQSPNTNNLSSNTTPYYYSRAHPSIVSTSRQQSDPNILLGQIRNLLKPEYLQGLSSTISPSSTTNEQLETELNQIKARNAMLKAHLKHWEDELTDLIDKRISLELYLKHQQQQ